MHLPGPASSPVGVVGQVSAIDRLDPLDAYPDRLRHLVGMLLRDGVDALEVTRVVAEANDILTRRLLLLAESHLGPPPCRYAWLALGSQGRGEQVLSSDQDSAIAYELPPTGDEPAARSYLAALADLVVTALARAGLPRCDGGYMATTWCLPLPDFARLFRGWVEQPQPHALLQAEVFLDVRACHGDLAVDELPRTLAAGGARGPFRVQMARAAVSFRPPFGWFGRLRTDDSALDVKRAGTAAVVLLARLYALAAGSTAHSTARRLDAAAAAGSLSRLDAQQLTEAYELLTRLRLRHQVDDAGERRPPDNRIRLDDLTAEERRRLRAALRVVRDMQHVTAARFATHTVT